MKKPDRLRAIQQSAILIEKKFQVCIELSGGDCYLEPELKRLASQFDRFKLRVLNELES